MRIEEIKEQNEKFYYCENYILSFRRKSVVLSFFFFLYMTITSCWINFLFLKQKFLIEASTQQLGYEDVLQWVNTKVYENLWGIKTIIVLIINIFLAITIMLTTFKFTKSYDVYKKGWLRILPVVAYALEIILIYCYYRSVKLPLALLIMGIRFLPILCSSRLIDPLGSRPEADEEMDWTLLFDLLDIFVFKE